MTYDLTLLKGASMLDWFLIANYWTDGILFIGISIMTALIVFAISKYSNNATSNCLISSTFAGFFVSLFFWLMKFQGVSSVPTYIPFLFASLLGVAVLLKIRE